MAGLVDGRSISGARQALRRLLGYKKKMQPGEVPKPKDPIQAGLLKNYMSLVDVALLLQPAAVLNGELNSSDLDSAVGKMLKEKVAFPLAVQESLLSRYLSKLVAAQKFDELSVESNPWADPRPFDPLNPKLADLSVNSIAKVDAYENHIFGEVLCSMIAKGVDCKDSVYKLAKGCLTSIDVVDDIELDETEAERLSVLRDVATTLVALTTDEVDDSHEVHIYLMFLKTTRGFGRGEGNGSVHQTSVLQFGVLALS